ncbi:Ff.00g037460.m01.CDS01 [Fusarium sp. VM40]|nr:Ff.00g037460.m01.CDS01 [Fusarium sp. VM40]
MSLTAAPYIHSKYGDTGPARPSKRYGHASGRSMDVTATTINRTSPLDFNFAKIQPLVKNSTFLEPNENTPDRLEECPPPFQPERHDRTVLRFSSNAGIIEHYSQSWFSDETASALEDVHNAEQKHLIGSTTKQSPRWPFINDDGLNLTHSADVEPLFQPSQASVEQPRQCHRIDEDLQELAALYVPPLEAVPEAFASESPLRKPSASFRPRGKVMTSAEFEALQKRTAREDAERRFYDGEEDDDKIDYDCLDEADMVNRQRVQRRKQQAHLEGYRQRMMKKTSGPDIPPLPSHSRVSSSWSMNSFRTFRGRPEDGPVPAEGDDEDDVPLALLQLQRYSEAKQDSLFTTQPQPAVNLSQLGPNSPMPAFARNLPQNPFPGNASNTWPMNHQQLIPGGLVGVIASEERAKAMRRVAPSHGFQPLPDTNNAFSWTAPSHQQAPINPPYGMPGMQTPMPQSRPQTPVAVPQMPHAPQSHEMFNFLQAQTEFLRTMASMNQQRSNQPWDTFSSQQSVMNVGFPGTGSTYAPSNYARSVHQYAVGYAPSVAPSERNTVGLPSRYRPVSKAVSQRRVDSHVHQDGDANINTWPLNRREEPDRTAVFQEDSTDEEEDEAFWRAKKAKRDRRKAMWIQENDLGINPDWIT